MKGRKRSGGAGAREWRSGATYELAYEDIRQEEHYPFAMVMKGYPDERVNHEHLVEFRAQVHEEFRRVEQTTGRFLDKPDGWSPDYKHISIRYGGG